MIVEDCTIEPYVHTKSSYQGDYETTDYKVKMKIDGKWYVSEKNYETIEDALEVRDDYRRRNYG